MTRACTATPHASWRRSMAMSAILSVWFATCWFCTPSVRYWWDDIEPWIKQSIAVAQSEGAWKYGGFIVNTRGNIADANTVVTTFYSSLDREPPPDRPIVAVYPSQVGAHSQVICFLSSITPLTMRMSYYSAVAIVIFLNSSIIAYLARAAAISFGPIAELFVILMCAASWPLAAVAAKVFWCWFLFGAPWIFVFSVYPTIRNSHPVILHFAIFLLVTIKAMCGYEWISCVILAVGVAVLFHETILGTPPRETAIRVLAILGACAAGCVVAISIHVAQGWAYFGTLESGWEKISEGPRARLVGDRAGKPVSVAADLRKMTEYMWSHGQGWLFVLAIGGWWFVRSCFPSWHVGKVRMAHLWSVTLIAGFCASISWNVLVRGHMRYHTHINFLCWYIPFNLLLFVFLGALAQKVWATVRAADGNTG